MGHGVLFFVLIKYNSTMGSHENPSIITSELIEFKREGISEEDAAAIDGLNLERVQYDDGSVCYFADTPDGRREVEVTVGSLHPVVGYYTGIDESTGMPKMNLFPFPGIDRKHITRSGYPSKASY